MFIVRELLFIFLIKNSRIKDTYYKQMDLFDRFQDKRNEIEIMDVLEKVKNKEKMFLKHQE